MTLTEMKYIIAVARERHFGRAAESCFVSQPSLSVAVRKLEEELGVQIFERRTSDVAITPIGEQIVAQAQRVIEETRHIFDIAAQGQDPLSGGLRLGVIYTIAPYLLPSLVRETISVAPKMSLFLREGFTNELLALLRKGDIDVAIMADTIHDTGFMTQALYQEDFVVAVPSHHPWVNRNYVTPNELKDQTMLLLGAGHCFRDQILSVCPNLATPTSTLSPEFRHTVEGSSLLTICHMVAQGMGITVLPSSAVPYLTVNDSNPIRFIPFKTPTPHRKVILVWRKSFTRQQAIDVVRDATRRLSLNGCFALHEEPQQN